MNSKLRLRECATCSVLMGVFASPALAGCTVYDSSLLANQQGTAVSGSAGSAGDANQPVGEAGDESAGGTGGVAGDASFGGRLIAGGTAGMEEGGASGRSDGPVGMNAPGSHGGSSASSAGSGGSAGRASAGAAGSAGSSGSGASAGMPASAGASGMASVPVELSRGKASTCSSFQAGNEASKGNDGSLSTKFCPVDGSFPQWWRVDLGAPHALSSFSVTFEQADRKYTYKIETSADDSAYVLQASLSGTGQPQKDKFPPNLSARYVRITVTDAAPRVSGSTSYPTWGCFMEFAVLGN